MPSAPDGNPPLAFVMSFATFVGNTTVPLSLVLLGASLGRMAIPRPLSRLPLPAIFLLAFAKLALMPILGVIIVRSALLLPLASPKSDKTMIGTSAHLPDVSHSPFE
jgi:predicted permease